MKTFQKIIILLAATASFVGCAQMSEDGPKENGPQVILPPSDRSIVHNSGGGEVYSSENFKAYVVISPSSSAEIPQSEHFQIHSSDLGTGKLLLTPTSPHLEKRGQ